MALKQTLNDDLKAAMKAGEKTKLSTIRMLQAAVKNKEIDNRVAAADPHDKRSPEQKEDELIMSVIKTLVKQRKDSVEQFVAGGRQDLADQETAELKILESYLPSQLSQPEVAELVKKAIQETGATSKKDMGNVMKAVLAMAQGRADSKIISDLVKAQLP